MTGEPIEIPAAWNGPSRSANGGIAAGVLARRLIDHLGLEETSAIQARLHRPPPVGVPMAVVTPDEETEEPAVMELVQGDHVMVTAQPGEISLDVPQVSASQAREVTGPTTPHPAATCIVCGSQREDGLRVFPGVIEGVTDPATPGETLPVRAAAWQPPKWAGDEAGMVRTEFLWGVLDCPGAFASTDVYRSPDPVFAALGTTTARLLGPVRIDEEYVVLGWSLGSEGRKMFAGTAIVDTAGGVRAISGQTCLAMPAEWARA